jgi:hypothetical protein
MSNRMKYKGYAVTSQSYLSSLSLYARRRSCVCVCVCVRARVCVCVCETDVSVTACCVQRQHKSSLLLGYQRLFSSFQTSQ